MRTVLCHVYTQESVGSRSLSELFRIQPSFAVHPCRMPRAHSRFETADVMSSDMRLLTFAIRGLRWYLTTPQRLPERTLHLTWKGVWRRFWCRVRRGHILLVLLSRDSPSWPPPLAACCVLSSSNFKITFWSFCCFR